jgi:uncharacterized protein (DUF924 family)
MTDHDDVVSFWRDAGPTRWFARDDAFDERVRARFADLHHRAARRELHAWRGHADGTLALVLVLDQFPRNLFRDSAHAFATDGLAREVADAALARGHDRTVDPALRLFFYLPFEHAESLADQDRSVALVEALGDAEYLDYARRHRDAIRRFGRFPHRNAALGRRSTPEELEYLSQPGAGF